MTSQDIRFRAKCLGPIHDLPALEKESVFIQHEIAAQLAEFNEAFRLFARDTEDIANLLSHSIDCPCCNCHEDQIDDPSLPEEEIN